MLSPPQTRASLLARLTDTANGAAWSEFVEVYGPLVYQEVGRRGVPNSDREDVSQTIFIRLLTALPTFQYQPVKGRFRDWFKTIIGFEVGRYWRDTGRRRERPIDPLELTSAEQKADAAWPDAFLTRVLTVALERSRNRFDTTTWEAFVEVWVNNRSAADVAKEFGKQVDWVYIAKSRVLKIVSETVQLLVDGFPFSEG